MYVDLPKVEGETAWGDGGIVPGGDKAYRAAAARLTYMALDRPDAMFAANE